MGYIKELSIIFVRILNLLAVYGSD